MNKDKTYWTLAGILLLFTAAVPAFGTGRMDLAGLWVALGCMFLILAFTLPGRSWPEHVARTKEPPLQETGVARNRDRTLADDPG